MQAVSLKRMDIATVLVMVLYARDKDDVTKLAAETMCRMLRRPTHWQQRDSDLRRKAMLGRMVGKGLLKAPDDIRIPEILFHWKGANTAA